MFSKSNIFIHYLIGPFTYLFVFKVFRARQHLRSLVPVMNDIDDDNDGKMIFGDLEGLTLPDIRLREEEKPRKNSPRKLVTTGDRTRARCETGAYATTWPIAVDSFYVTYDTRAL